MAQRKHCGKCRITRNELPIMVKLTRVDNEVDPCGRPCHMTAHGINRFPGLSTTGPPAKRVYKTDCETCQEIIRQKDLQIFNKEHEMMKLMLDLITLPKTEETDKTDANVEHNYKGLRDIERELLKRDQELAKLKLDACDEVCYNALRQKQLELRWKDFELENRQPIIPRFMRHLKKKYKHKKAHNCFKKLQKKELELKEREQEVNEEIENFRERQFEEELADLKAELEFRRKPFIIDADVACSCDCARINEIQEREKRRNEKLSRDACLYMPIGAYIPFWSCDTMERINDVRYCLPDMARVTPCRKRKGDMMARRLC